MSPDAGLTPRQRELIGAKPEKPSVARTLAANPRAAAKSGNGRQLGGPRGSGRAISEDRGSRSAREIRRFESADTGLKPLPPSTRSIDDSNPRKFSSIKPTEESSQMFGTSASNPPLLVSVWLCFGGRLLVTLGLL